MGGHFGKCFLVCFIQIGEKLAMALLLVSKGLGVLVSDFINLLLIRFKLFSELLLVEGFEVGNRLLIIGF